MNLALVLVSNGRGALLDKTMRAIEQHVTPEPDVTLVCDDSGDMVFSRFLQERLPSARIDAHRHMGHGPAVAQAWKRAAALEVEWVLWMEEDMMFCGDIDLRAVASVISWAGISQMVFRRNSHFPAEVEAGPTQVSRFDPALLQDERTNGQRWLKHRLFYSLNPHLVNVEFLRRHRWPPVPNSEHHFGLRLFRDPQVSVGLWGGRDDPPLVLHAGTERTGTGY